MQFTQRIAGAAVAVAMIASLAMPLAAGAVGNEGNYGSYSIEQLEQLIAKLQKQLEEMKKGSKCFVSDKDLSIGDGEGDDGLGGHVRRLQDFLREKGHLAYKSTGYFGKMTRAAVTAFQKNAGIAQTGEFDAATRAKAHALYCKGALAKQPAKTEPKKESEYKKEEPKKTGAVKALLLKADGRMVKWMVDGYSAQGFKVVWSKTSGPTYPNRESDRYQYFDSSSATSSSELEAFDGAGTYYVRVCEYLGGSCGVYSNEVKVQL